jgi:nicotinamidase-related amidase
MEQNKNQQNTALLVMDVQGVTVNRLKDSTPLINSITKAIQTARKSKMPVIYVVIGFRKGYPEVSPNNKSFSVLKNGTQNFDTEDAIKVHASIAPEQGDVIITKKRVSAFTGSDLEVVLRSLEIKHLVLSGIATSGVVLSTYVK